MVPATVLTRWLPPDVALAGVDGTVWSGGASSLSVNGRALGAVDWSCRPWPLLMLEWSCRVELQPPGGTVIGAVGGFLARRSRLANFAVGCRSPISRASRHRAAGPGPGARRHEGAHRDGARPRPRARSWFAVSGRRARTGAARRLRTRRRRRRGRTETLTGRLADLGGPLHVRGTIELKRDRTYFRAKSLRAGRGTRDLRYARLSRPAGLAGRRPFTVEGTL